MERRLFHSEKPAVKAIFRAKDQSSFGANNQENARFLQPFLVRAEHRLICGTHAGIITT
jgi:hypothetical protein